MIDKARVKSLTSEELQQVANSLFEAFEVSPQLAYRLTAAYETGHIYCESDRCVAGEAVIAKKLIELGVLS